MTAKSFIAAMLVATALLATSSAFAELIRVHHYYVDDNGDDDKWEERREVSKGKKDKDAGKYCYCSYERPPVATYAPRPTLNPKTESRRSFPRESAADRAAAKERQRDIFGNELAAEQQLLAEARGRYDDETVRHHERNIEALRRELRNLER